VLDAREDRWTVYVCRDCQTLEAQGRPMLLSLDPVSVEPGPAHGSPARVEWDGREQAKTERPRGPTPSQAPGEQIKDAYTRGSRQR
jgi:hypothetical protein